MLRSYRLSTGYRFAALFIATFVAGCGPVTARGQVAFNGARSASMAGASTALADDLRGGANPAAWAFTEKAGVLLHGGQLYGLPELRFGDALAVAPFGSTALALGASTFGFTLYRSTSIEMGAARRARIGTFRELAAGVRVRHHVVRVARYGSSSATGVSPGLLLPLTPFILLGASTENMFARGPLRQALPRRLAVGLSLRTHPTFSIAADVRKEWQQAPSGSAGVEIAPASALRLRAGVASSPFLMAAGIGLHLAGVRAETAAIRHAVLGWTTVLSCQLSW